MPYAPGLPSTPSDVTRASFRHAYRWWIRNWRKPENRWTVTNKTGRDLHTPYLAYNGGRLPAGATNVESRMVLPGDYGAARRLWKRFLADTALPNPRIIVAGYNDQSNENEQNGG